jgi:hypothetical protein
LCRLAALDFEVNANATIQHNTVFFLRHHHHASIYILFHPSPPFHSYERSRSGELNHSTVYPITPLTPIQSNAASSSSSPSPNVAVTTSFSVGFSLGPDRQTVAVTSAIPITVTASDAASSSGNATTAQPTSTGPLPTAPTNVNGGGNGNGGAPSPGQAGSGGIYGPPDGYVSGVAPLQRNAMIVSVAGVFIGVLVSLL